jgi:peptidoglycan-associated lipoprotein
MRSLTLSIAAALVVSMVGCAHEAKPPVLASASPTASAVPVRTAAGSGVLLSTELRRVCGIDDTASAPKFSFDASALTSADRNELSQLATCMTTGPLAGKTVELVGRADPRGEEEYNMTLGERRAESVVHYLTQLGVAESRLPVTSRGALDAQGHDEATWAVDRRVDLRLAGN